ncbi:MAG TPA: FkbM family methyltransferase [Chitinophagaceae bacterium]|nr:FkbM family methyltransferase [Chitinophagaceae bacterium]
MFSFLFRKKKQADPKPMMKAFYQKWITPGSLVFDIGANVGNRIDIFLELGANVVAVEPQKECIQTLREKFGTRISIENIGLSNKEGELDFHLANESTISSFSGEFISKTSADRFKRNKWEKTIKVNVSTFDKLIEKYGVPRFSKIDVEGFELEVLQGLNQKVSALSFEYCVPEMSGKLYECLERIKLLDPSASYNYSVGESFSLSAANWLSFADFSALVKERAFHKTGFGDIYVQFSK